MLVLSRKAGEQIHIGSTIEVAVLKVRANKVHLGISGPPEIPVHRQEVYNRINAPQLEESLVGDGKERP
jgi:carbon storage regulator